jgi:hypothetical protein
MDALHSEVFSCLLGKRKERISGMRTSAFQSHLKKIITRKNPEKGEGVREKVEKESQYFTQIRIYRMNWGHSRFPSLSHTM